MFLKPFVCVLDYSLVSYAVAVMVFLISPNLISVY